MSVSGKKISGKWLRERELTTFKLTIGSTAVHEVMIESGGQVTVEVPMDSGIDTGPTRS